jgi:hypothetical protein
MKQSFSPLKIIFLALLMPIANVTLAQDAIKTASPFKNKLFIGLSYNNYWTTVTGESLTQSYFYKPSLGFTIKAEYYFTSMLGVSTGAGFQQRGAGIISPDNDQSLGNPDSTYRKRLRFNSIEFPFTLLLRTPKDLVDGVRLKATAGFIVMNNIQSNEVFLSIEDGNHSSTDVSTTYWKNDLAYQFSIGPEIDTGSGILQVDFVYSKGTKNAYNSNLVTGYNQSLGFRISWLFPYQNKRSRQQPTFSLK